MRRVATLIRPQLLTAKNSFLRGSVVERSRTIVCALVTLLLGYVSYTATSSALSRLSSQGIPLDAEITPSLSILLFAVCLTVIATGCISALNTLFLGRDIETIFPAPIPRCTFLGGKVIALSLQLGWSLSIIGLPSIVAYGVHRHAPLPSFLIAPLACLLLLVEGVMVGAILALLIAACIPPRRGRFTVIALSIVAITAATGYIGTRSQPHFSDISRSALMEISSRIRPSGWYPSTHAATGIVAAAAGDWRATYTALLLLAGIAVCTWVTLGIVDRLCYQRGLAMCQSTYSGALVINHPMARHLHYISFPWVPPSWRAIISKEYRSFARDLIHAAQLGLILTLSLFFLMFFQVLERTRELSPLLHNHGETIFLACNIFLSSFVVLSICARFVFPSLSLERDNFWILQSAPLSPRDILRAKCHGWFVPIAPIAATISCSGAMALGTTPTCIAISGIISIVVAYGLVGLGIGVGAVYKHTTWEYEAQLGTSTGNFIFMGLGLLGIALQTVPAALILSFFVDQPPQITLSLPTVYFSMGLIGTLILGNIVIRSIALRLGARVTGTDGV